jgi:hypothetical protein
MEVSITNDFVSRVKELGEYRDSRLIGFLIRVSNTGSESCQV